MFVIRDIFVGKLRFVAILTVAKSGFDCMLLNRGCCYFDGFLLVKSLSSEIFLLVN